MRSSNLYRFGFSLFELIVVISVVGILCSILYASVSSARKNAAEKAKANDLIAIQIRANSLFEKWGCYSDSEVCPDATAFPGTPDTCQSYKSMGVGMFQNLYLWRESSGFDTGLNSSDVFCVASPDGRSWAMTVPYEMGSPPNRGFCIDSTHAQREVTEGEVSPGVSDFGFNGFSCK